MGRRALALAVTACAVVSSLTAQAPTSYLPYEEARTILASLKPELLPTELRPSVTRLTADTWRGWVSSRDAAIRARLAGGDADSVVNFLLFGTSFTQAPRATERDLLTLSTASGRWPPDIERRIDDLAMAAASTRADERLAFVRDTIARRALPARQYLQEALARAAHDAATYAHAVEASRRFADPAAAAQEAVTAFRDRGLSSDTSLFDDLAIEQALGALRTNGLLAAGSVRRIAVVGPGLDFTDKHDGYDFYPPQSIQPFAVADSLLRVGLATPADLHVTTFDLSPRINGHLAAAVSRAKAGEPYPLVVPRNLELPWTEDMVSYWNRFGDRIGSAGKDVAVPADVGRVAIRSISVRPAIVSALSPLDLNIVTQRLDPLPADQRFDVIVATNILVYYDVFEQSLAAANISRMLRPGGFLLCNTGLLLLPSSPLALAGYSDVIYMRVPGVGDTGDRLYWYRRM